MIRAYFDGACEPNPGGKASYGYVVYQYDIKIHESGHQLNPLENGHTSNNIAEYCGLIATLKYLLSHKLLDHEIYVFGDSQLVIKQISGLWNVNKGLYVPYYKIAIKYAQLFTNILFEWIPKERNTEADKLSRGFL